jgi:hypothetical protein
MERVLGNTHRLLGLAAVALFLVTGLIMRRQHLELLSVDSGLRMLFRSRHVYLLFSGLVNVTVGLGFVLPSSGRGSRFALSGSILMLLSPLLLAAAFFLEPMASGRAGRLSALGVFVAFLGVGAYSLGTWRRNS